KAVKEKYTTPVALGDGSGGGFHGAVHVQQPVDARQLEDVQDAACHDHGGHFTARLFHAAGHHREDADAGAVDVFHLGKVHNNSRSALAGELSRDRVEALAFPAEGEPARDLDVEDAGFQLVLF